MLIDSAKAEKVLRYWKASLAWKNIGDWAAGWSQGSFIDECRELCQDNGLLGFRADCLLDDMIHDVERSPLEIPGIVVELQRKTEIVGQDNKETVNGLS